MFKSLSKLFRASEPQFRPELAPGERVYAIGDIHGRADLFAALIDAVEADDAARTPAQTTVILLGDLVDRGPDSAGVIAMARAWQQRRKVRILAGNHEEMFIDSFASKDVLREFLRHGGRETILSYPVDPEEYRRAELGETQALMRAAIPAEDIAFIQSFEDRIVIGDYAFVHAGVRPGVPIAEQRVSDLRWIRRPFLEDPDLHEQMVVHGHSIADEPQFRVNRIGIDTGAYASGRLTALGLEGETRWLIETSDAGGAIACTTRSAA